MSMYFWHMSSKGMETGKMMGGDNEKASNGKQKVRKYQKGDKMRKSVEGKEQVYISVAAVWKCISMLLTWWHDDDSVHDLLLVENEREEDIIITQLKLHDNFSLTTTASAGLVAEADLEACGEPANINSVVVRHLCTRWEKKRRQGKSTRERSRMKRLRK